MEYVKGIKYAKWWKLIGVVTDLHEMAQTYTEGYFVPSCHKNRFKEHTEFLLELGFPLNLLEEGEENDQ